MRTLRELLSDGRVHVVDGAMGTMLYGRGVFLNVCYDELSLKQPDLVRDIHREYVRAGAELIETNTFGANPVKLATHGLAGDTERINSAAAGLAREAAGERAAVAGAIGPLGVRVEPFGELSLDEARAMYERQVRGLLAGGVDGFILETFSDVAELGAAVQAVKALSDLPIIAQMTVGTDGKTHYGTDPLVFGPELAAMGVDVIGVNCSVGPHGVLEAVEKLARVVSLPISAQPNAGLPREVGDRKIYMASPEYMASYARRLVEAGARFVGGCCGTTPA
jgi:methionine synthase I (cobalamin-dependent)